MKNMADAILSGVLLDEVQLSIDELARACAVERTWIVQHVQEGFLECVTFEVMSHSSTGENEWRFASRQLVRARKLVSFERDFDANPEVAALLVDLLEEIAELRRRLSK